MVAKDGSTAIEQSLCCDGTERLFVCGSQGIATQLMKDF